MGSNKTSAAGSVLGFLFQIERVIMWLSELHSSATVGIEVADDIVVKLNKGESIDAIYEQAKNTTGKNAPYTDNSEDLWKTLHNWIKGIQSGEINSNRVKLSILSNKPIPSSRFVLKLSKANNNDPNHLDDCYQELIIRAKKVRGHLQPYGDTVVNCPETVLKEIISNIEVLDNKYEHNTNNFLDKLKTNLSLSEDIPVNNILEKLTGFVTQYLISCWTEKREGWIRVETFNQQFTQLVADYKRKPFIEKAIDSLPVTKQEIKKNRTKTYVQQLQLIKCEEDEILESIHDYYRAATERNRFAKDGEISSEKYDQYFHDLIENWKTISRPRFKFCKEGLMEETGFKVFYETLRYKGKLNNYEPEQPYTYKGSYHHLANELKIGWHPQWKEKLIK